MQALRLSFISARIRTWNLSAPLFRILGFKSNYMECSDLYIGNCKDDTCVHIYIYMYSWNPNDPCCEWKGPSFGGFKPKIEDKRVPGLYIYIYILCVYIYIHVDVTYIQGILAFCCPLRPGYFSLLLSSQTVRLSRVLIPLRLICSGISYSDLIREKSV